MFLCASDGQLKLRKRPPQRLHTIVHSNVYVSDLIGRHSSPAPTNVGLFVVPCKRTDLDILRQGRAHDF